MSDSSVSSQTLADLVAQPDNAPVLRHLGVRSASDPVRFVAEAEASPYDEGGQIFFEEYGRGLPARARCMLSHYCLFVHPRTARIFALHQGRFTVALRADFARCGVGDAEHLRVGVTLDGDVDLRALGPGWALFRDDDEDAEAQFAWAYELAGR